MSYAKPNLFELGEARALVLGDGPTYYVEDELTTSYGPVLPCELEGGDIGAKTIIGCVAV